MSKYIANSDFINLKISSRELCNFTSKSHGEIRKSARELRSKNIIGDYTIRVFTRKSDNRTLDEYIFSILDIDYILQSLKPKPKLYVKKKKISPRLRKLVFSRDKNECKACGSTNNLCLDHIVPEYAGGLTNARNLQILCRSCNARKGTKLMHEFMETL